MLARKALAGTAAAPKLYVESVFSSYLYTGNGSTQTITNDIDLSTEGGLVWIKKRDGAVDHVLQDTERGTGVRISSNTTNGNTSDSTCITAFNNNGFSLGSTLNSNAATYVSWAFRQAKKFFDVVTYTGNGSNRTISHNLGSTPGCIIVKRTDGSGSYWTIYHRSLGNNTRIFLNTSDPSETASTWNNTSPTSTEFSLGTSTAVNDNGGTYVAYLFAHDAGGFGDAGSDSIIKCGSFTTNSSGAATVTLDWEPQWLLVKASSTSEDWNIGDNMRGMPNGDTAQTTGLKWLKANSSGAEAGQNTNNWYPTATGFKVTDIGYNNATFVYIAIRRGPMKTPETGTSVFTPTAFSGNDTSGTRSAGLNAFDLLIAKRTASSSLEWVWLDKLRGLAGDKWLSSVLSTGEGSGDIINTINGQYTQDGINITKTSNYSYLDAGSSNYVWYALKRAPKFFDTVCYTGNGTAGRTFSHNLAVSPELVIIKARNDTRAWQACLPVLNNGDQVMFLDATDAAQNLGGSRLGNDATYVAPTSSVVTIGSGGTVNGSGTLYVAYLFATLAGVSKVGSYTGTGSSMNIDCGFTNGARFILIKQTDGADNWYVWDTARGIVSGNEKYLQLNKTAVESTAADDIDPYSAGFTVNNLVNSNGAKYIFLAIA